MQDTMISLTLLALFSYTLVKGDYRLKLAFAVLVPLLLILAVRTQVLNPSKEVSYVLLSVALIYALRSLTPLNLDRWVAYVSVANLSLALSLPVSVGYFPVLSLSVVPITVASSIIILRLISGSFGSTNLRVLSGALRKSPRLAYLFLSGAALLSLVPLNPLFFPSFISAYLSFTLSSAGIYGAVALALSWFLLGWSMVRVFNSFYGKGREDLVVKDLRPTQEIIPLLGFVLSAGMGVLLFVKYLPEALP